MSILFIAGPGRSGTTAFADYLNVHPRVAICRERYKRVPEEITPEHFSFSRILDYRDGETNIPRSYHEDLLSRKDPEILDWVGDKAPGYVRDMRTLQENNPGARFVIMYRPVEEVAESYDARSKNLDDPWLGGRDGIGIGVRDWNLAMKKTRSFVRSALRPKVLIVEYNDFFYNSDACALLVSRFLDLDFDEEVRSAWRKRSRHFENRRRDKPPLTASQKKYIEQNRDRVTEEWVLGRLEEQWRDLGMELRSFAGDTRSRAPRVERLEVDLLTERAARRKLETRLEYISSELADPALSLKVRLNSALSNQRRRLARIKAVVSKRLR